MLAPGVTGCHTQGADHGDTFRQKTERLLEELGHGQTGNYDFPEDGHVVWIHLCGALLQGLDDGLLHVPAGIPSHSQQRADVVVPGKDGEWQGCMGGHTTSPTCGSAALRTPKQGQQLQVKGMSPLSCQKERSPSFHIIMRSFFSTYNCKVFKGCFSKSLFNQLFNWCTRTLESTGPLVLPTQSKPRTAGQESGPFLHEGWKVSWPSMVHRFPSLNPP